jgi:flavin-dependent dehydrogenase
MEVVARPGENPTKAMSRFRNFLWKPMNVNGVSPLRRLGCKVTYAAPKGLFYFGTDRILVCGEASGLLNLFGEGISSALSSGIIAGKASARAVQEGVVPGYFYKKEIEFERQKTQQTFDYRKLIFQGKGAFNFKKGIGGLTWKDRILFFKDFLLWMWRLKR